MNSSNSSDSITGLRIDGNRFREGKIYTKLGPLASLIGSTNALFNSVPGPLTWSLNITEDRLTIFISKDFDSPSAPPVARGFFKATKFIYEGKAKTGSNLKTAKTFLYKKETAGLYQGSIVTPVPSARVVREDIWRKKYDRYIRFDRPNSKRIKRSLVNDKTFVEISLPPGLPGTPPALDNRANLGNLRGDFSGNWWNQRNHMLDPITS
jgi:hypothetical protein